jgi:hypothetical protein
MNSPLVSSTSPGGGAKNAGSNPGDGPNKHDKGGPTGSDGHPLKDKISYDEYNKLPEQDKHQYHTNNGEDFELKPEAGNPTGSSGDPLKSKISYDEYNKLNEQDKHQYHWNGKEFELKI